MGWLEFSVVVGCALLGFIIITSVINSRQAKTERRTRDESERGYEGARDEAANNRADQQRKATENESPPRSWWEVLNVGRDATPMQIKEAFRREISKYHPDRVEGLGIELRELADQKAKEVNRAYTLAKAQRAFS